MHFWKILVGFCAYLEVPRGILCIVVSFSYNVVHFWKFLVGFCAFLEFPHGKAYTCSFHPFTFCLQNMCFCNMHADWLQLSLAAKRHSLITNIRVTRPRLMRRRRIVTFVWWRCPSLGLSQIILMIWYDFLQMFYLKNFYCK